MRFKHPQFQKKTLITTAIIVILIPTWILALTMITGRGAKDDWVYVPNCSTNLTKQQKADQGDDDSEPSAPAGGGGSWLSEGTSQYKTAIEVGKWWKKKGASASGIWGVMGNVAQESGFTYNIYQGGGTNDHPESIGGAMGTNGWGLYQISPGNRINAYGWSKSKGIGVDPQSNWAWHQGLERSGGIYLPPLAENHSIDEQTKNFYGATENAVSTFGAGQGSQRISFAKQAEQTFKDKVKAPSTGNKSKISNGGGTEGASAGGDDSSSSDSQKSNAKKYDQYGCPVTQDNDSDAGSADGDIVKTAKKYNGWFPYLSPPANLDVDHPVKTDRLDCSSFVTFVLYKAGYKLPDGLVTKNHVSNCTTAMWADAIGPHKYLKKIPWKDAKAGDIIITGGPNGAGAKGHVMILEGELNHLDNLKASTTMVINEGGDGDNVNEDTLGRSALTQLSPNDESNILTARVVAPKK